jgi:EAL and modified HD-GYP domain-containing signal transduction protein
MTTGVFEATIPEAEQAKMGASRRLVVRRPILDLHGRVHAYELLFRFGPELFPRGIAQEASPTALEDAAEFGLEELTGGVPAHVRWAEEAMTGNPRWILPPPMTVLEIPNSLEPAPELPSKLRKLKALGFRLALDKFSGKPQFEPLVDLADCIKLDFRSTGRPERRALLDRLRGKTAAMLAQNVDTLEEYRLAQEEGFTLFQGYYFCQPAPSMKDRKVPANRIAHIEILRQLQYDPMDLKKIARLVERDAALTFALLRLVNSPIFATRQEVDSVKAALIAVGENRFRRIAMLAIAREFNDDQPAEILRMAILRARFCEMAAPNCGLGLFEQYVLGLLSLLPAMLCQPMSQLTPTLPLRLEIRNALEGTKNRDRALLGWLESHERGDWAACDAIAQAENLDIQELANRYIEAVAWAEAALRSVT